MEPTDPDMPARVAAVACLQELLGGPRQGGAAAPTTSLRPLPQMPDGFEFKDFMASFAMPQEEPPKLPTARDSMQQPGVKVQYVPVPYYSTPYGFCPVPMKTRSGYASQTQEALKKAVAACPEGFTLMPAAEVYKEYPDLQQQQRKFSFDQPEPSMDVTPESTTGPMLESFIPGGRNQQTITGKYAGDGMMLEKLLPDGRQRQPATTQDPTRKVFVGGLNPSTTAEGLRAYFEQFGPVSEASVVTDKVTQSSRGFGFVMFEREIPAGLLDMQHIIESRRCGVRDYGDARV
jgi:hypothetical protein